MDKTASNNKDKKSLMSSSKMVVSNDFYWMKNG